MKNTTKAVLLAIVVLSIIVVASATAVKPIYTGTFPWMTSTPGLDVAGGVSGRVTTFNTTVGIADADVYIVNAYNSSMYYWHGKTNAQGFFQVTNVNNTWVDASWQANNPTWATLPAGYNALYYMYVNDSTFGEGRSNNFSVEVGATAAVNVIINPIPAHIKIYAQKTGIVADGVETVKIWAYVTDALNNPVADNTRITFAINQRPVTGGDWPGYVGWNAALNGSIGAINQGTAVVGTVGGYANTTFGWVPEGNAGNNSTIVASIAVPLMPQINDSIKIYFQPTVVSWFGSVVDTFLKGQGGVPVTLHVGNLNENNGSALAGKFQEVYTLSTTTMPDMPYPGAYGFDNIILWPNVTTAYATAEWTIADNVTISGKSNYYGLNKSMTSSGFIMLHVPLPDALTVSANPDIILVGGDTSVITAQLYLNGAVYRRSNVPISFLSDNSSIAYLPTVKTNLTDANGQATILLTSGMLKGTVTITAYTQITVVNNLTATCQVQVVGWGTISGMVTDKNKNGVPNATVKLWRTTSNDTGVWSTTLYPSPENPQQTVSNPNVAAIGTYTYYRIPSGIYNVTAEKADASGTNHIWFAIVNLTVGTATNNVAIPDLVVSPPSTPTPTAATPTTSPVTVTPTPSPTPTPTPTPTPGFETVFALAGLLGVAYLIARKEH